MQKLHKKEKDLNYYKKIKNLDSLDSKNFCDNIKSFNRYIYYINMHI